MEYNTLNIQFIDHGESYLPFDAAAYGTYFTQFNATMMYLMDWAGHSLYAFYLKPLEMHTLATTIPVSVGHGCIASFEMTNSIYISGGDSGTQLQVFDLDSETWLTSTPSMNSARNYHPCLVEATNHRLYAIAGYLVTSIESVDIVDIQNQIWTVMTEELPVPVTSAGVTSLNGIIYIISGFDDSTGSNLNTVYMIDTSTDSVTTDILPYSTWGTYSVAVGRNIYAFGGALGVAPSAGLLDSWIWWALPATTAPSGVPSQDPTIGPSSEPTVYPSVRPSSEPTVSPSTIPTSGPTVYPKNDPSLSPTMDPTVNPTVTTNSTNATSPTVYTECGCDAQISLMMDNIISLQNEVAKLNNIRDTDTGEGNVIEEGHDEEGIWGEIKVTVKGLGMLVLAANIAITAMAMAIAMVIVCKRPNGTTKVQPITMGSDIIPIHK